MTSRRKRSTIIGESDVVGMDDVPATTAAAVAAAAAAATAAIAAAVKQCTDGDIARDEDSLVVGHCNPARIRCDADTSTDHENVNTPVHSVTADSPALSSLSEIKAFIKGTKLAASLIREGSSRAIVDKIPKSYISTPLLSSCLSVDGLSHHDKESCSCDTIQAKRNYFRYDLLTAIRFQNRWTELQHYIRNIFNTILETDRISKSTLHQHNRLSSEMHDIVLQLCKRNCHQFFMRLVSQVQEFVMEVKLRLLVLLHDRSVNNLAEVFLTGLLNDYDALISTAVEISKLVKPLKEWLLLKFNLTWDCFIKKLYQIYVYNDPLIQNNLPIFIGQLRKLLPLKGSEYQDLVHRYLYFDDEMTRITNLWPETEPWMDKYNAEQAIRMTRITQIREAWELFTETRKLMEQSMLRKSPDIGNEMREIHEQFSSLIAHTSGGDSRPQNPTVNFNLNFTVMPPSIEIVQILLDDWNKAQNQKLPDIAGALAATEVDAAGHSDPNCTHEYARTATCHLGQYAITSVRIPKDDTSVLENGLENGKECECDRFNEKEDCVDTQCKIENFEEQEDKRNSLAPICNGFPESSTNCAVTPIKKKLDNSNEKESRKESNNHDTLHKSTNTRTVHLEPCSCVYQHAREITEKKEEILENPPCPCLLNSKRKWDTCPCLTKSPVQSGTIVTNNHQAISPTAVTKTNQDSNQKPVIKTGSTQSAQIQTRHSTTQTPNTTHNHNIPQSFNHWPLSDMRNTVSPHLKRHTHKNHTSHACHKQANIEHIKRVSCNDLSSGDGDCSDSGSSQEDSCSTSSSTQRDANKHCDCCYCEVFGHGVPSVAPVSRNYNEMRERLRQLLTKKKAKKCKATDNSPPKSPLRSSFSNTNCESRSTINSVPKSNPPISVAFTAPQNDDRDIDSLLEFIEGNHNGKKDNNKKTEKKERQKQRKLEEKLKKDRQEAQRQKLIELQKKTPEVTITVVDPKKPVPQRLLSQCNLPEVSILPTSPRVLLPVIKQLNNKKKDKQEVCGNGSSINGGCISINNLNNKTKTPPVNSSTKNKSISNTDKCEIRSASSNQGNKTNIKSDKPECNRGNKLASINTPSTKKNNNNNNNASNNTDKLTNDDLLDKKLTKKERKKLKKEMKKLEELKIKESENSTTTESQPQIVTIKRVLESNSAEPTVTITLKGQTPAEDKVLFTLVNGQTKEPSHRVEQEPNQNNGGKKKKAKANNNGNKLQQSNNSKQQTSQSSTKNSENGKNLKQQTNNEKSKQTGKQTDEKKNQSQNVNETKNSKSKKDKKNTENKENVLQQQNTLNKSKNQQNATNKKQNKTQTVPSQMPVSQKQQQQNHNIVNEPNSTNKKTKKQQQQQEAIAAKKQPDKNVQTNIGKNNKNINTNNVTINKVTNKNDLQKTASKTNQITNPKQRSPTEVQNTCIERVNSPPLSSQFKDIGPNSKINIENLKLPPGITITKVDAPVKPLPIRTSPMPKPVNPPKQTTIIAAPMSGVQSSYASPQAGGNVIVVDTGKLKQDLIPKANEKDPPKESQAPSTTGGKKKKKKNKNSTNSNNAAPTSLAQGNDAFANDHVGMDEPAKILHNPGTNMVTIRNPSFGPMKVPPTQQAAIIKVSENGMVTIRSPALQQAINAGLTSATRPDYVVKSDMTSSSPRISTMTSDSSSANAKHTNGVISPKLTELRNRLTPTDCSSLPRLANIQISKVTRGQPIPENGINLKGTSVTLTKVRPAETNTEDTRQSKSALQEAMSASVTTIGGNGNGGSGKSKKKKKRGNGGTRQCGDDWNLVESVFTPKDIEDGEMDDAERELEAFKRFCWQSVPSKNKEKVNLNIKDIVLKKKSSSSSSSPSASSSASSAATATVIAAN